MKKKRSAGRSVEASSALLSAEDIVETLKRVHKPLRLDDFLRVFALPRRRKKDLERELSALLEAGSLLRLSGGAYCLATGLKELTGTLHMQRSGVGFVLADPPRKNDVFISPQHLGDAWHGDRVAVALFPGQRGKNRDGRILRVLERARKELAVRVIRRIPGGAADGSGNAGGHIAANLECLCESTDPHISALFLTDCASLPKPPERGDLVRVRPGERRGHGLWQAEALALLGDEESPAVQEELVKADNAIPRSFPADALKEAGSLPTEPSTADMAGRRDLSAVPFVTIDGDEARDFDDAVHVEKKGRAFVLRVAIADVAHYVSPRSALDAEAFARGNSYYFPRSVEPMLPPALSNELCSLNPHVPRLVMVAEMTFDERGAVGKENFYSAVIRSAARLTYDGVRDALADDEQGRRPCTPPRGASLGTHSGVCVSAKRDRKPPDTGSREVTPLAGGPGDSVPRRSQLPVPPKILPMLREALELAQLLTAARKERGSLDFDLPEPRCLFAEDGSISAIVPRENHFIHKLIEVFMVAANEAVARFLTAGGRPLLYRAHPAPDPDKLKNLFTLLAVSGLAPGQNSKQGQRTKNPSPGELQAVLESVKGSPAEYLISRVALRAMMQAGYTQDLEGHFGLASDCYCHFTSPIRRYADLVVHRSLKAALALPDAPPLPGRKALQGIADHINETERRAMDADRELFRRLAALYMQDKVGEEFDGIVSGLTEFGIFVELGGVMAEGMLRLASLGGDYYVYYPERFELRGERGGRIFRLGQALRVRVTDVNPGRQEINLELAEDESGRPASRGPRGRREQSPRENGRGERKRGGRLKGESRKKKK